FSIPWAGTDDQPLSHYRASSSQIQLTDVGWNLERSKDGSLRGDLPDALVPVYRFAAVFRRADRPTMAPIARPIGPAPQPIWTADAGASVFGGVAYDSASRRVLVGTTGGRLVALKVNSGAQVWAAS